MLRWRGVVLPPSWNIRQLLHMTKLTINIIISNSPIHDWAAAVVRDLINVDCWHISEDKCESIQSNTSSLSAFFTTSSSCSLSVISSAAIGWLSEGTAFWLDANVYSNFYKRTQSLKGHTSHTTDL